MLRNPIQSFRRYLLDRMVLRPSRHPLDHAPQKRESLKYQTGSLDCFVRRNFASDEAPELLVLKFPGTAGRGERSTEFPAQLLNNVRTSVWSWNPPGYGQSTGPARLGRIADAAIEFWNQVVERGADQGTTVWLCGNSLGCVTALHVAATMKPDPSQSGLILRNPPPLVSVVKRVAARYPLGKLIDPVAESVSDSMNALVSATQSDLPAVFLQSELDLLVPVEDQNQVIEAYAGACKVVLMEGLGHASVATEVHQPLIQAAIDWLWQQTRTDLLQGEPSEKERFTTTKHER